MLYFLPLVVQAPVPFVLGVQYKTAEVRGRCGGLVRVNVYKDRIKNAGALPQLPSQQALADALAGTYAELRCVAVCATVCVTVFLAGACCSSFFPLLSAAVALCWRLLLLRC